MHHLGCYVVALSLAFVPSPAFALLLCDEPRKPWCIVDDLDEYSFDSCRFEVEQFVNKTRSYIECLNEGAEEASKAAKEAVDTFNCRADGNRYC